MTSPRRRLRAATAVVAVFCAALTAGSPLPAAAAPAGGKDRPPVLALSAVGDTILGNTPTLTAHPRHYLAGVRHPLRHGADVVFANLEDTLTDETASKCGSGSPNCYAFRNPPAYGDVLADIGFTALSTANNHSHDFGTAGYQQTRDVITAAGMVGSGAPGEVAHVRVDHINLGVVAFAPYSYSANMLDIPSAEHLVRRAHHHSDVVLVYMHAGAEGTDAQHVTGDEEHYVGEDRGNPRRFAHHMITAGADVVIGSGPHVLRGMEFYRDHLIAYSLGNFANYHNFSRSGQLANSVILRLRLGPHGRFLSGRLVPVLLVDAGRPTRGGDAIRTIHHLSRQDFGTHAAWVNRAGLIRPPA